jgi:hypothetical protein
LLDSESLELKYLLELLNDLDETACKELLNKAEENSKETFIENLSRHCAIEILTNSKMSYESMQTCCKLSPGDFILCAKRTQEIINSVHELVIKGENLSSSVPGA